MGWFKKKPQPDAVIVEAIAEAPAPVLPPPDRSAELVHRWDLKIAEVHARLQAVLSEAVMASQPLVAQIRSDLNPLVLPWNAIAPRVHEAREEVSEFWSSISDEMSASGSFTHEMMRHEGNKRDVATGELELLHERMYGAVMASAAEQMRQAALGADAAAHACNHCGAQLDSVAPVSGSLNVECGHCKAINTVHPGDALRMFAACGAMHLAIEAARPSHEVMKRLDTKIKQYRDAKDVPLALLIELEATSRAYWTTRIETEARYNPEEAKYVAGKLERYMKDVQRTLRRFWQWREHETNA